jgi:predicted transcriptional regulator
VPEDASLEKVLGPLEAEVMHVLWAKDGPVSVREVLGHLNKGRRPPLAYTTVMTVMARLAEKEILRRELDGRGYRYEAEVPDAASIAVREVMRDFGEAAMAQFVDEARADPKILRRLRRLLNDSR